MAALIEARGGERKKGWRAREPSKQRKTVLLQAPVLALDLNRTRRFLLPSPLRRTETALP